MKAIKIIVSLLCCLFAVKAFSQDKVLPLRYSFEEGTYLYFSDKAVTAGGPRDSVSSIRVSRDNGKGFKVVATLSRAASMQDFKKVCGDEAWQNLKLMKSFSSDDQQWKYIIAHPSMEDYGMLSFSIVFRQAMGNAFLDREAAGLSPGKQWKYKAEWLDATGKVITYGEGMITGGKASFTFPQPHKLKSFANDSLASLQWYASTAGKENGIILANVYRQRGGKGAYQKMMTPLLGNVRGDSVLFYCQDVVEEGALYRYFIKPKDELGNEAGASDTINVLSFDFANLPLLQDVKAKDSLNSIWLSWKPLQLTAPFMGIEVQRSRDARGAYVVVDTLDAGQTFYQDTRVFPAIPYFYRMRLLPLKGLERDLGYTGFVTAFVKNLMKQPDAPFGLAGEVVNGSIKLTWEGTDAPDLYAYFVYRSVSGQDHFEVISPGITTTVFTDTTHVSGRTQYAYAVKAVNKNSMESEFSNVVTMRQAFAELPQAPAGVHALLDNKSVSLTWPSAVRSDHAVAGYNVYRREAQTSKQFDGDVTAAAQADKLKFILLNRVLIRQTGFVDDTAKPFTEYEYAVSSVDVFGMESTYSPFSPIRTSVATHLITNCSIRKVSNGVELAWDNTLAAEAETLAVYRKKAGETGYQRIAGITKGQSVYVDKTAVKGSLYIYVVSAERGKDVVARSEEKNIRY